MTSCLPRDLYTLSSLPAIDQSARVTMATFPQLIVIRPVPLTTAHTVPQGQINLIAVQVQGKLSCIRKGQKLDLSQMSGQKYYKPEAKWIVRDNYTPGKQYSDIYANN